MVEYIDLINDVVLREKLTKLHLHFKDLIESIPASVKYHHNWTGGYRDHVRQVIEHAIALYHQLYSNEQTKVKSKPDFTTDDVILLAYIHDLDKLFRYQRMKAPKDGREWEYAHDSSYDESAKVTQLCAQHGIVLEDLHLEALAMHHGGWSARPNRDMSPLAVIIHSADLISTYIMTRKGE